jgi:DNA-binding MarR family transcriptional regulator
MCYDTSMDSTLPPRYVKLSAREVYDSDLPDALFRTLAQIRGLAYRFGGKRTPPLTVDDLIAMRGRSRAAVYKHLAELRRRGIIRTEPADVTRTFVVYLLRRKKRRGDRQHTAAQAAGEATLPGPRDDGSAGPAAAHHAATFPRRWESGAASPAFEREDAPQAPTGGLLQPGPSGCVGAPGARPAGAQHGAKRRRAGPAPSPGPPPLPPPHANGTARHLKNETPGFKNETRQHVVVIKDHESNQEKDLKQQHERAFCKNESDFDALLQDLAGVLAEGGMRPAEARRRARRLLEECGVDVCARQRQAFERRCELARASRRGLSNPVGLLLASIRGDWSLPAAQAERKTAHWYTDEEFEAFFEH